MKWQIGCLHHGFRGCTPKGAMGNGEYLQSDVTVFMKQSREVEEHSPKLSTTLFIYHLKASTVDL